MSRRFPKERAPAPTPLGDTDPTDVDDTIADRTLIVDMEATTVDRSPAALETAPTAVDPTPPGSRSAGSPAPTIDAVAGTATDGCRHDNAARHQIAELGPDDATEPAVERALDTEDLRRLGLALLDLLAEMAYWVARNVLRPGLGALEAGIRWLASKLRPNRREDSDAYSRRRGQQWQRFREGDPSINELREFDERHRAAGNGHDRKLDNQNRGRPLR